MTLPVIEKKWYKTKILNTKKEVKFRPFTVGEQKKIMLTKTKNPDNTFLLYEATMEMVNDCVENIDVKDLFPVQFESLFYEIKSISDGDILDFSLECPKCKKISKLSLNSKNDIAVENEKNYKLTLNIPEAKITADFQHLKMKQAIELESKKYDIKEEKGFDAIVKCLKNVKESDKVHTDFTPKEANTFIESLPSNAFKTLTDFFKNAPALIVTKNFSCKHCETKFEFEDKSVKSFL